MEKLINLITSNKKILISAFLIVGMVLVLLSNLPFEHKKNDDEFSEAEYVRTLEMQVADIVSSIDGAGACKVMISLVSTAETVYVKENKKSYNNSDNKSTNESEDSVLTMTDGQGNQYAVITKQIMPQIGGVTVVCNGGYDSYVKSNIIEAVSTVLNIGSNKVCVIAKAN